MLDADLAGLYGISTKVFNQAIARNLARFPEDFMFRFTKDEFDNLRSQFVTSSLNHGGSRYLPYAFTEHGVAMLSSVLKSPRAVQMNISIIRAFIKLREILLTHKDLAERMEKLEQMQGKQGEQIIEIYAFLKKLIEAPKKPRKRIGFRLFSL